VYDEWNARYKIAGESLEKRDEKMEALQEELEENLTVLGATAIEDKL
jgi:phospholipid-translocating ATPase